MGKVLLVALVVLVTAVGFVYYAVSQQMIDAILERGFSETDTEVEFTARVDRSLGLTASEDASYVLEEPVIEWELQDGLQKAEFKYKVFLKGESKVSDVRTKFFKTDFKSAFGVSAYYKEQDEWRPLLATAKVESTMVSEYVLAFDLVGVHGKKITATDIKNMTDFAKKVAKMLNLTIDQTDGVEVTLKNADVVYDIAEKYLRFAFVELQADWNKVYTGKDIHDAAMGLGLTLTPSEHYAWYSTQTTNRDVFFMMFSGDESKSFVPEKMAKSSFKIKSLVFGFIVPLTYAPEETYANMVKAAKYYQERFGGRIVNADGETMKDADFAKKQEEIAKIARELEDMGFQPGSFRAFSVFD